MSENKSHLQLKYKFWIESNDQVSILGEGKWILLKAIRDTGSLKAAVDKMGYAYRQTWDNLKKIEEKLGFPLIEKSRGGAAGGQTVLTRKGVQMVEYFERLYNQVDPVIQQHLSGLQDELNKIIQQE
ncbi:MAG: LysR family transcriptional regulator [Bacteroidales bacterium]|nr:LysR family transcriptional regulator [Bacteroidales bacterium]